MITSLVFYDFVPSREKTGAHNSDRFSFRHILYLRPSQSTFRLQREKRKCERHYLQQFHFRAETLKVLSGEKNRGLFSSSQC